MRRQLSSESTPFPFRSTIPMDPCLERSWSSTKRISTHIENLVEGKLIRLGRNSAIGRKNHEKNTHHSGLRLFVRVGTSSLLECSQDRQRRVEGSNNSVHRPLSTAVRNADITEFTRSGSSVFRVWPLMGKTARAENGRWRCMKMLGSRHGMS